MTLGGSTHTGLTGRGVREEREVGEEEWRGRRERAGRRVACFVARSFEVACIYIKERIANATSYPCPTYKDLPHIPAHRGLILK